MHKIINFLRKKYLLMLLIILLCLLIFAKSKNTILSFALFIACLVTMIVLFVFIFRKEWREQGHYLSRGWAIAQVLLNLLAIPLFILEIFFPHKKLYMLPNFIIGYIPFFYLYFVNYWISLLFRKDDDRLFPGWYLLLPSAGALMIYISVIPNHIMYPLFGAGALAIALFFPLKDFTVLRRSGKAVLKLVLGTCMFLPTALYMFFPSFFNSLIPNAQAISILLGIISFVFYINYKDQSEEINE